MNILRDYRNGPKKNVYVYLCVVGKKLNIAIHSLAERIDWE